MYAIEKRSMPMEKIYRVLFPKGSKFRNPVPIPKTLNTENPQLAHPVETSPNMPPPPTKNFSFVFCTLFAVIKIKTIFTTINMPVITRSVASKGDKAVNTPSRSESKMESLYGIG
ncbi:MAG: hypothetical protein KGL95_02595 [Patescibacteria group bacterium]|nr:hypothetical protein [Patescibacteria group bacterium]